MVQLAFTCEAPVGGTVEIEVQKPTTMLAPSQVWLRAINMTGLAAAEETGSVYEAEFHEYYYEWTIVGEPLPDWTKTTNLIPAFNNPNKAYGREVAFLLPTAGDYTITLTVTDKDGKTATATTSTITVTDPLSHYSTTRRIYVDPDGDFTGVPASDGSGAPKTATTIDSLRTELDKFTWNVDPPMVLFRGGKTHSFATRTGSTADAGWMKVEQQYPGQYWTSFGTGRATLTHATTANRDQGRGMISVWGRPVTDFLTFTGIDFTGGWNAATERGDYGNGSCIDFDSASQLVDTFVTMHDLNFSGWNTSISGGDGGGISSNNRMVIADCTVTNFKNYGIFLEQQEFRYALLGNNMTQNVDALHGGDKEDALCNHHGPFRLQSGLHAYIAMNDVFSRTGWSPKDGPIHDGQPCLRMMVRPRADQRFHIERNVLEGGYQIINVEDAVQSGEAPPLNGVIENNLMVATAQSWGQAIGIWRSSLTIRNNTFVIPNVPSFGSNDGEAAFRLENEAGAGTNSADMPTNPIVIHSNTVLNLKAGANNGGVAWPFLLNRSSYFTNLTSENNVHHAPSLTVPVTADAPIDTSTAVSGFTPRFKGTRWGYEIIFHTLASAVANGASFTLPYSVFLKRLNNAQNVDGGGATNQAYWTAISGTDTKHLLYLFNQGNYLRADIGHFSVTFGASDVTFTNNSGFDWTTGQQVAISLDRTSLIPAMDDAFYGASAASPATIPLPRPQAGSAAIGAATSGRVTRKDALLVTRPVPRNRGALNTA